MYKIYLLSIFLCFLINMVEASSQSVMESACKRKPSLSFCQTSTKAPIDTTTDAGRKISTSSTTKSAHLPLVPFPFGSESSKDAKNKLIPPPPKLDPKIEKELEQIKQVKHSTFIATNHWGFDEKKAKIIFNRFMAEEDEIKEKMKKTKQNKTSATQTKKIHAPVLYAAKNSDDNLDPFGDIEKRTEEADSTSFEKANKLKSKDGVFELDKNARKLPAPLPSSSLGHYENTGILKDLGDVVNVNGGIAVPVPTNDPVKVGLKFGLGFGKGGRAGGMPEFLPIPRQGYLYSLNDFDGYQNPTPNRAYKYWKKVYHIPDSNEKIEEDVEKDTKIRSRNEPKDPFSKQ